MTGSYACGHYTLLICFLIAPKPFFDLDWVSLFPFSHRPQSDPETHIRKSTRILLDCVEQVLMRQRIAYNPRIMLVLGGDKDTHIFVSGTAED